MTQFCPRNSADARYSAGRRAPRLAASASTPAGRGCFPGERYSSAHANSGFGHALTLSALNARLTARAPARAAHGLREPL